MSGKRDGLRSSSRSLHRWGRGCFREGSTMDSALLKIRRHIPVHFEIYNTVLNKK